jgi:hypothetical protein
VRHRNGLLLRFDTSLTLSLEAFSETELPAYGFRNSSTASIHARSQYSLIFTSSTLCACGLPSKAGAARRDPQTARCNAARKASASLELSNSRSTMM